MQHVMNDPVHGLMQISADPKDGLKSMIDHPLFQRLRHIKQLGMAELLFPGAVHTRFNHSIGVAFIAGQILEALAQSSGYIVNKPLVLLGALLHDVGHGPFSHAFEQLTIQEGLEPVSHEDWTPFFLRALKEHPTEKLPKHIISILEQLEAKDERQDPLISEIISSQLDADRMDYLLRDSHFCGVAYGHFDLSWVIHCLRPIQVDKKIHLGISHKGIGAVEAYLLARRLMTHNVYHHPKVKRVQVMMIAFLKECCEAIETSCFKRLREKPFGKFLLILKHYREGRLSKASFMEQAFRYYQYLTDHHVYACLEEVVFAEQFENDNKSALAKRLYQRDLPKIIALTSNEVTTVAAELAAWRSKWDVADWQIGLEQGHFSTYSKVEAPILIEYPSGAIQNLGEKQLLKAVGEDDSVMATLYMDKALWPKLEKERWIKRFLPK